MALAASSSTQLGCGRAIDQVWNHLDQAPDAHELTCPYCRAARTDLADLAHATQALREDDATNPDLEPSPGVLDRILAVARAEVRRGRRLPLDQPVGEQTSSNTISEQAVNAVVRRTGDRTRHLEIRRCAIDLQLPANPRARPFDDAHPTAPTPSAPATVRVSLRVSVAHRVAIVEASDQLRAAVIDAVRREVGMRVVAVDIVVEDLHDA